MKSLDIKPGMQFHWFPEDVLTFEQGEDRTMSVLATPTGWLVELWSANHCDMIGRKLIHSQLVPDKEHLINPRAFWNEEIHGKLAQEPMMFNHDHERRAIQLWEKEYPVRSRCAAKIPDIAEKYQPRNRSFLKLKKIREAQ